MPNLFISIPYIKIGGSDAPAELMNDLLEVVVDNSLHLPSMFTIKVQDAKLAWVDDARFDLGKEVEISVKTTEGEGNTQGLLIKGEITSLEPHFFATDRCPELVVRGYDKSHRLHRGKKSRTFLKQTDSDVVKKIAGEAGLSAQTDATTVTYDFILQNNLTNMEFLQARAARIGYQVYSAEGKLYFKKGDANLGSGPELKYAEDLIDFQPRYTTSGQADKMTVRGWDPKQKQTITSQGTPVGSLNQGGLGKTGGAAAQSAFGAAEATVVDQPVFTTAEAAALATGLSDDISREFVEAEGICEGNPAVKPGYIVTLKNLGTRFSGKYLVTSVTHIYDITHGYQTRFTISGRQPNTLSHLLDAGNGHAPAAMQGVVVGLVTNQQDPDDLGRVKVKYPWLGDNIESDWIRIASPMAGSARGFQYLPEVNDEVLIAFEHGDVHHPYIIGALWSSTDKPPKKNSEAVVSGKVNQRIIKTRAGHIVLLDDKQGEEKVEITSKSGHTVILDDKSGSEKITIKDKSGNNSMVIDSTKNSMTISVNGDFTVDAKGKVTIKATQAMSLESQANGTLKAMQLTVEGSAKAEVKAPTVSVAGQAMTEVKGALVKIN